MKIWAMLLTVLLCTPAIMSAQGSTASIDGTWNIVMNGYGGKITFSSGGGFLNMSGYPQEKIKDLRFDGSAIQFTRVSSLGPTGDQVFTGTVTSNTMQGTLTQTSIPGSIYQWNATRPKLIPPPPTDINFGGRWNLNADGFHFVLELEQHNDRLQGRMAPSDPPSINTEPPSTIEGTVQGREIIFRRTTPGMLTQEFRGYIYNRSSGNTIGGVFEFRGVWNFGWYATR